MTVSLIIECLLSFPIQDCKISKTPQNLDLNKAHGHDKISIHMQQQTLSFCRNEIESDNET